ncbi:MAG TPA: ABC transporter ATP-binding protein [Acidobacteriota bacterium]|nr:ABC transporter ATP-binding protein [Acidobacteriota bacterium]
MSTSHHSAEKAALLEVRGLHVEFLTPEGLVHAVNGVDFDVARGESLAIVGESGSGKTVAAMALVGLVPSPPARIRGERAVLNGLNLLALDERKLSEIRGSRIGFVFQDPLSALNPVLTIGRQISEVIERHLNIKGGEAKRRAVDWLVRVGIADSQGVADSFPHQLSGGMRQRAMIAMGLAGEPELLIADEPTTALDVTVQAQIVDLMLQLRDDLGMALVWISHDLGVVAGLADRVAVMYAGRIVESGSVQDLYGRPAHPYTRGLISSVPDLRTERLSRLATIPGGTPDPMALPPGCAYFPRCGISERECDARVPVMARISSSHWIACTPAANGIVAAEGQGDE